LIGLYTKNDNDVWFGVACDEKRIFATNFGFSQEAVLQGLIGNMPSNVSFQCLEKLSPLAEHVLDSLKGIYHGKEVSERIPLATEHLSKYFRNVIEVVSLIPLGYASSYGSVAKIAGGSARAVGRVMAMNPFAPIVPCHRVVGSDYTLGGYGGGLETKLAFLRREKRGYTLEREIQGNGKKLLVFPVEFVLKKHEKR